MTSFTLAAITQAFIDLDTMLTLGINGMHNAFWDVFMPLFSSKNVWVLFYATLVFLIARNFRWRVTLLWFVAVAVLILFCDQLCASVLRPVVCRLRPCDPENPLSDAVRLVKGYRPVSYSCPSAHAANSWALATFVACIFRRKWLSLMLFVWAALTCYSRLYLGVHYLGDVLMGMLIGCVAAVVLYRLVLVFFGVERPEQVRHLYVPAIALLLTVLVFLFISGIEAFSS